MTILFVSDSTSDGHLLPVLTELGQRGHEVQIFNPAAFPQSATVTVESAACGPQAVISGKQQRIDLNRVGSVWYRRPGRFLLPEELLPAEAEWLRNECSALINGLYANTDALWVSDPHNQRRADLKLLQLRVAQQLGFRIPAYTITNDPERARSFLDEHPGGVIVKGLWLPTVQLEDRIGVLYTHRITPEDEEQLESVRYGPTFLQALVPKARDIRVTIIGEQLFATGIETARTAAAHIDFRRAEIWDLPHIPISLPEPVADACLAVTRELGLQFGAIDLLETPEGEYVFLEINPNGQWYWVELMTGQPMARAMADLLERGETERGRNPDRARAFRVAEREASVLSVGGHTIPFPAPSAHPTNLTSPASPTSLTNEDGRTAPADLTATSVWFEKKPSGVLLHVGDVEGAQ